MSVHAAVSEPKRIEEQAAEEFVLADARRVRFAKYLVTHRDEVAEAPKLSPVGNLEDVMARYCEVKTTINRRYPRVKCVIPHAEIIVGDRPEGDFGERFRYYMGVKTDFRSSEECIRPAWSQELERYARLRQNLMAPTVDNVIAHLTSLAHERDGWYATIGQGLWSSSRCTMDSAGLKIEVRDEDSPELRMLAVRLVDKYKAGTTIRQAMRRQTGSGYNLIPYDSLAHQWGLGVGGSILTHDGKIVITRRGRGIHVNAGRIYASGGGVLWDAAVEKGELFAACLDSIQTENHDEIGDGPFTFEPIGATRELTREGSPEFFYLIRFGGTVEQLLEVMARNPHPDRAEIDRYVYAFDPDDIIPLLENEDGTQIVGQKGMVILLYIARHLGIFR